jgi:hypothetical protein
MGTKKDDKTVTAASLLTDLPTDPKKYTEEQLGTLMDRYEKAKAKMSTEEQVKIRAIGQPATIRLAKEAKKTPKPEKLSGIALLASEMMVVMSIQPPITEKGDELVKRVTDELAHLQTDDFIQSTEMPDKAVFSAAAIAEIRKLGVAIPGESKEVKKPTAKMPKATVKEPTEDVPVKKTKKGEWKTKMYKPRTADWTPPPAKEMPIPAPKNAKVSAATLAWRVFLKNKGKLSVTDLMTALQAAGKTIKPSSAQVYLFWYTRNIHLPKWG